MEGFYPSFTNVSARTSKNGNFHEKMALTTCTRAIYSSRWARHTAIDCYGIDGDKLDVVNFGANVAVSYDEDQIMKLAKKRWEEKEKHLLFVGVEWERKGGPKALEAVRILAGRGYPVKLAVAGCQPGLSEEEKKAARLYGYLSKKDAGQAERLRRLYEESFLFFMPSLYECTAIVYAEAAAFGLPSVASDAGGVSNMVIEGESGLLLAVPVPKNHCMQQAAVYLGERGRAGGPGAGSRGERETKNPLVPAAMLSLSGQPGRRFGKRKP